MGRGVIVGKREEWAERVSRQESSGQSVGEFCRLEGVSVASFYNWRRKLRGGGSPSSEWPSGAAFVPVRVSASGAIASADPQIEVRLPNGVRILVPMTSCSALGEIIAAAGGWMCEAAQDVNAGNSGRSGSTWSQSGLMEDARC